MGEGTHHQNSPVGKAVLAMGTKPQGKERRVPERQHGSSPATCAPRSVWDVLGPGQRPVLGLRGVPQRAPGAVLLTGNPKRHIARSPLSPRDGTGELRHVQ